MTEEMAYISRAPCRCIWAVIVDDPTITENQKRVAKFCADEIRSGSTIELVSCDYVRQSMPEWITHCTHGNNPKSKVQKNLF